MLRYRKFLHGNFREDYNITVVQKSRLSVEFYLLCPPPLSKKGGHIALLLSVGPSTVRFHSFSSQRGINTLNWNLVYSFIITISRSGRCWVDQAILDRSMPLGRRTFLIICSSRSFIFFAEEAIIVFKFQIQVYHDNIYIKYDFGYKQEIISRVMPLGRRQFFAVYVFVLLRREHIYWHDIWYIGLSW